MIRVRPFSWRDIPALHAFRNQTLFMDHALLLTRGSFQVLGAMLSTVAPHGKLFTAVAEHETHPRLSLIGQVMVRSNAPSAHLTFLSPRRLIRSEFVEPLMAFLAPQVAAKHATRILAEANPGSDEAHILRRCGFVPYGVQRIWRLPAALPPYNPEGAAWRMAQPGDNDAIQRLYRRMAPPLVQQVSAVLPDITSGLVLRSDERVLGYVGLRYGLSGVVAQPLLQPELSAMTVENLFAALGSMPFLRDRPLYTCVTADQEWIETLLLDIGAQAGETYSLLVKPLTTPPLRSMAHHKTVKTPGLLAL
ncbi:MAG: hypothetical protein Fur0018_05570 [Anaerolineales bacterium]